MEEMDDRKREMDAMDFGLLGHHALSRMAAEKSIRSCRDAGRIAAFLAREADAEAARRFGRRPPLPVRVQVEAAKRRLGAAADAQAALCEAGWQIMLYEEDYETDIEGTTLRARIDRVDRHRKTGRLRILDYKTSDIAESPVSAHVAGSAGQDDYRAVTVGGKTRRWVSLQLPLYAALLGRAAGEDGPFEIGYFNLPAAAAETKVVVWDPPDPGLPDCAMRCAREIAARIRGRVFWPPAERVQYESFAPMFWEKPDLCVDSDRFMEYCAHA
jgi:ATP-dependent helicase/nuclease subunit B